MSGIEEYLRRKSSLSSNHAPVRTCCYRCRKPQVSCYCSQVKPIETDPRIVILMHPLEAKHPVGTGRMSHQCLANSELHIGVDFSQHDAINRLIADPKSYPVVLFPGPQTSNLSLLRPSERQALFPRDRQAVVIVIDGTWHLAKKMLFRSKNLHQLPQIAFTPQRLSRFQVRKQPHPQCFSTLEAIHEVLSLMNPVTNIDGAQPHDILLEVFDNMVAKQLSFRGRGRSRHRVNYQARKAREAQTVNPAEPLENQE